MSAGNFRVAGEQSSEFTLAEQPGELPTMLSTPGSSPMLEEGAGVRLDGEPSIGRGHRPVPSDSHMFGNEGLLVGFVPDVFDNGIRDHQIERVLGERQMAPVGDHEVLPGNGMFGSAVELVEKDSARDEDLGGTRHPIRDDVLERLVLPGLDTHDQDASSIESADHVGEALGLAVSVVDTEPAGHGRDEVAHDGSLWHALVAKPLGAIALVVVCFLALACSPVSSQEGTRNLPAATASATDEPAQSSEVPTEIPEAVAPPAEDEPASDPESDTDSTSTGDRGGRNLGDESTTQAEPAAIQTEEPTATSEPVVAEPVQQEDPEPEATAVATTEPLPPPTPTPPPTPNIAAPVDAGPLPSDEIVIQGPIVDESESANISDAGAIACALTESAIEFLDFGDVARMAGTLLEASQSAAQAAEPEISSMAANLAAAGASPDAAIDVIIATLSACAIHGYQV